MGLVKRKQCLYGFLLVFTLLLVFTDSLLPGVGYHGDTAKFQYVGKVLGTPHATGYPTYILINHFFTQLFPLGSLAYKANLLSALLAIMTCLLLYVAMIRIFSLNVIIAFFTSLSFGLTFTFWSQAIVAEVYTLHSLFLIGVIYCFLQWRQTKKDSFFYAGSFLYAVSFGNHLTMITLLPAIVFFVWNTDRTTFFQKKKIFWVLSFIILGALQYSYLFWRYYSPDTPYLEMATSNLEQFFWFIFGAQFKSRMFAFTFFQVITERIPLFLNQLLKEYFYLSPLAIIGVFKLKDKGVNGFLLLCFLGNVFYAINYNIPDISVYLIPNILIIAIYMGLGFQYIFETWQTKKSVLLITTLAILPLLLFFTNRVNMRHIIHIGHQQKVEAIINSVHKNALIVSPDEFYSQYFWYYLIGEKIETKRKIYLIHHVDINLIIEYMVNNKPIYLPEERKYVPKKLKVYCILPDHVKKFKQLGYKVTEINKNLFRVFPTKEKTLFDHQQAKQTKTPGSFID